MKNTAKNTTFSRISALRVIVIAVVLVLFFSVIFAPSVAEAVCPDGYVESVKDKNLDWQNGEDELNLEYVKTRVKSWLSDPQYDFSALEKDPIVVAVVDTGINFEHEIFTGKYDENGVATDDDIGRYDVLLRDEKGNILTVNTANELKNAYDDASNRHGTHVAGIIATLIHELDLEKYIKILPIKASKGTSFSTAGVKKGIAFAIENGADVVNLSLCEDSAGTESSEFNKMITDAYAQKAVFVAAAGNDGKPSYEKNIFGEFRHTYYPAASKNVIGVMNYTTENGKKKIASTSNYGSAYDICATGMKIFSADGKTADSYKSLDGTSMATPFISFASALAILKDRAYCAATGEKECSAVDIAQNVKQSYTETIKAGNFTLGVFDFEQLISDDTRIRISADGDTEQYVNATNPVKFKLNIFPSEFTNLGSVVWKVNGKEVENDSETQFEFTFVPENEVGVYTITAEWTCAEANATSKVAECQVEIKYVEYDKTETGKIEISITNGSKDVETTDKTATVDCEKKIVFSIDESILQSVNPTTPVLWFVDGVYVAAGNTFVCEFERTGVHYVKAKIGNYFTSETSVYVYEGEEEVTPYDITAVVVVCVLVVCLAVVVIGVAVKKKV